MDGSVLLDAIPHFAPRDQMVSPLQPPVPSRLSEIRTDIIDPLIDDVWDGLVAPRRDHSIFHRSAWARVLVETYGHRPFYLRIRVGDSEAALVPVMEVHSCLTGLRGVSLPFSDFAGPLWIDVNHAGTVYDVLLRLAAERKWKHLEIRGGMVPPAGANPFVTHDAHQLDLRQGIEAIGREIHPAVRRAIRNAEGSGLVVGVERGEDAMAAFYDLHAKTRRRHGLPPQPYAFFQAIGRHLMARDLGEIVLARLGGVPVAGAVFLHSEGRVVYKFGASDTAHWPKRPNHLVMWAAIRHFAGRDCRWLHFGRTSQADEGLSRFKSSWGCDPGVLRYYRHESDSWAHPRAASPESHPLLFGHLPISFNRIAGRLIYPHLD